MRSPFVQQKLFLGIFLVTGHSALFRIKKGRYLAMSIPTAFILPSCVVDMAPASVPRRLFNRLTDPNAPHLDSHQNPPSEAGGVPPTRWLYLRKSNAANERDG